MGSAKVLGENEDVVRIMSIHKSKGLEYPIVFVSGMGKKMNAQDNKQKLIIHHEMGIGIDKVDTKRRVKYQTLLREIILEKR